MGNPQDIPTGVDYIGGVLRFATAAAQTTREKLDANDPTLATIGNSLSALYQIGTCTPTCRGGQHLLEALSGRAHNHGCGSLLLIDAALYDESLNLTRSVAEIANLLVLFRADPAEFRAWVSADRSARIRKFGPAAVRKKLRSRGAPLPISESWYVELCETATHPVPGVAPNAHQKHREFPGFVGGLFQQEGYAKCVFQLSYVLANCAIALASMFGRVVFMDLIERSINAQIEYRVARVLEEKPESDIDEGLA